HPHHRRPRRGPPRPRGGRGARALGAGHRGPARRGPRCGSRRAGCRTGCGGHGRGTAGSDGGEDPGRGRRTPFPPPRVVAHRGSSALRAEHTLAAYELALEEGADGLECDVRLTVDGHLVCIHDRTVDRTSDGTGAVSEMTMRELDG